MFNPQRPYHVACDIFDHELMNMPPETNYEKFICEMANLVQVSPDETTLRRAVSLHWRSCPPHVTEEGLREWATEMRELVWRSLQVAYAAVESL